MSSYSMSFLRPSISNISFDVSAVLKQEPISYANSLASIYQHQFEVQMIKDKYQREYNRFHKAQHKRSKSQLDKINQVIQDASKLNQRLSSNQNIPVRSQESVELFSNLDDLEAIKAAEPYRPLSHKRYSKNFNM